jgi:hypothetical protein
MQKTIRRIRPTGGLIADVKPWEVGDQYYTRMANVLMRAGFATRIGGSRFVYGSPTNPPLHLDNVSPRNVNYWLYFCASTIFAVDSTPTHTNLTPGGGLSAVSAPWQWSTTELNGLPVANNQVNSPMSWDGNIANKFVALTGWPASTLAGFITAHRFHLFAFDITASGTRNAHLMMWSDAAAPGTIPTTWTPAASNEAGSASLAQTPGYIVTAKTLRDALIVYKSSSAYVADYIGGGVGKSFSIKGLWARTGALSPKSVVDVNGKHLVVTDGDVVLNDGFSDPVSVANLRVQRLLFDQLDPSNFKNLCTIYDPTHGEVWILFPQVGATYNTLALVWNVRDDNWGYVELTAPTAHIATGTLDDSNFSLAWSAQTGSWASDSKPWVSSNLTTATESIVTAEPTGTVKLHALGTSDLTVTNGFIAHYSLPFDDSERIKFIRQVHIRGSFTTLKVRIGSQMFPEGPTTWAAEATVTSPAQPIPLFTQGRYISYEIRSNDSSLWIVTGIDVEYEMRGYF